MTESKTKICQNCQQSFSIEPDNFAFYEKMHVPAPTWCPECRSQRRLLFRNDHFLYKRKSDFSNNEIFSRFSDTSPVKVYENEIWHSDKWEGLDYGTEMDFSKPFLPQLHKLLSSVPLLARAVINSMGSDYSNNFTAFKNCYLCFGGSYSEDCAYSNSISYSKDSFDLAFGNYCELCYEGFWLNRCNRTFYSSRCEDCVDVYFSTNLRGCSNCFACTNLRNKNFHIFNIPYSQKEYSEKLQQFNLGSYQSVGDMRGQVSAFWLKFISKYIEGTKNTDVTGEYIFNSRRVKDSYLIIDGENLWYCQYLRPGPNKDCHDVTLFSKNELAYESAVIGEGAYNIKFSVECYENVRNLEYCLYCKGNVSDCFGCVALRNKQYCILNKQYSKEEYEVLVPRIVEHMNTMPYAGKQGRVYKYGEFFPPDLSPFAYNETIAQEHFPLTKEQALAQGYRWRDPDVRNYAITQLPNDLPDHIKDVDDAILNETIGCMHEGKCTHQCTTAFKIVPEELLFYRRMNLPLPRLCPNCRHYERLKQRNPLKLWHRQCMCKKGHQHGSAPCPNEFETSYSPDRKEIVYCEQCYNAEVV